MALAFNRVHFFKGKAVGVEGDVDDGEHYEEESQKERNNKDCFERLEGIPSFKADPVQTALIIFLLHR